jgi:glycosidase
MPWTAGDGVGFTEPGVTPWLPARTPPDRSVAAQRDDPASTLSLARRLIALRRANDDLREGAYESLPSPPGTWMYRRGTSTFVALNLSETPQRVGAVGATVALSSVGEPRASRGHLELAPWEAVVLGGDRGGGSVPRAWV